LKTFPQLSFFALILKIKTKIITMKQMRKAAFLRKLVEQKARKGRGARKRGMS